MERRRIRSWFAFARTTATGRSSGYKTDWEGRLRVEYGELQDTGCMEASALAQEEISPIGLRFAAHNVLQTAGPGRASSRTNHDVL